MKIPLVRVAELAEQVRGVSYAKEDASPTERPGYLPLLRAGNITEAGLDFDDLVFVPATRISSKQRLRRNDIVIAASSGSRALVGKAARAVADYEGAFGAFCKVLRPGPEVDPSYFSHFFKTRLYREQVAALAAGVNINNLRKEHLDDMQIPMPPLSEQRRIAEILDAAERLRTKRGATRARLAPLMQSIFLDMFGDPVTNPKGWPQSPIIACTRVVQIGPFGSLLHEEDYVVGGVPIINPKHIQGGVIVPNPAESVATPKYAELEMYRLRVGDVIMGRRGEMGRCAVVEPQHDGFICGTGSLLIRPSVDQASALYLMASLSSASMRRHLERLSLGATLPNLNRSIVEGLVVSLPPILLQHLFAEAVAKISEMQALLCASSNRIDILLESLQYRAVRGEL